MKKLINLVLSAAFILTIISCGSSSVDSSLPPSKRIQGTWKIVKAEGSMAEMNKGTVYKWDGTTMSTNKNDFETTGSFTATDSTIVWDIKIMEMNYNYHFEENTLVINLGGDQKFYLEKD